MAFLPMFLLITSLTRYFRFFGPVHIHGLCCICCRSALAAPVRPGRANGVSVVGLIDCLELEIDLVLQCMTRSGDGRGRHPVVVIEGAAGAGKSALLTYLATMCEAKAPYSSLDLDILQAGLGPSAVSEVLATLALQLARRTRFYGSLRFDRLAMGLLATGLNLRADAVHPAGQIRKMIIGQRRRTTARRILIDAAGAALPLAFDGKASGNRLSTVADLGADTAMRLVKLHQHFDWYGHQDNNLPFDAADQLVNLDGVRNTPGRLDRAGAQQLLVGAFLADLRDNFRSGPHADEWPSHCLLLLDNADTALGRRLLRLLLDVPLAQGGLHGGIPAPVTVVASSRGGLLAEFTNAELVTVRDVLTKADTQPGQPDANPPIWLRRRLSALPLNHVREMVRTRQMPADRADAVSALVHQIGGGHPATTVLLLDAQDRHHCRLSDGESLLASTDADGTVEDRIRDRLFSGLPPVNGAIDALVTCSAGRTKAEAVHLLGQIAHPGGRSILPAGMWSTEPEVHTTVLRLLLLRELARRPDDHPWSWLNAHLTLRAAHAAADDITPDDLAGQFHHDLALGNVDSVAAKLTACLGQPMREWLALLDTVTTAPRRPHQQDRMPIVESDREWRPIRNAHHHHRTHGEADNMAWLLPEVTSLIVALWTIRDPLCGESRHTLYWRIHTSYSRLIQVVNDSTQDLSDRIIQYQRLAAQWPSSRYLP
jgi:hypothetical protein